MAAWRTSAVAVVVVLASVLAAVPGPVPGGRAARADRVLPRAGVRHEPPGAPRQLVVGKRYGRNPRRGSTAPVGGFFADLCSGASRRSPRDGRRARPFSVAFPPDHRRSGGLLRPYVDRAAAACRRAPRRTTSVRRIFDLGAAGTQQVSARARSASLVEGSDQAPPTRPRRYAARSIDAVDSWRRPVVVAGMALQARPLASVDVDDVDVDGVGHCSRPHWPSVRHRTRPSGADRRVVEGAAASAVLDLSAAIVARLRGDVGTWRAARPRLAPDTGGSVGAPGRSALRAFELMHAVAVSRLHLFVPTAAVPSCALPTLLRGRAPAANDLPPRR